MTADSKRTLILLSLLAVVAVLVILDRVAASDAADETAVPATSDAYLAEAALLADTRAVAESKEDWAAAAQNAQNAWQERRASAIAAPSAEIAAARLRSLVQQLLADEGLAITTSETLPATRTAESEIAVVGIALSFEARDAAPIYRVIDRIENLPDAKANVESVALRGPGRMGGANAIQATLRVRAVAHLTGASRG